MVFGTDREFPPIYGFGWKPHAPRAPALRRHPPGRRLAPPEDRGDRRRDRLLPAASTSPCAAGTRASTPPRTRAAWPTSKPYPPFHDVMMAVDGDAARALGELARERWRAATGQTLKPRARRTAIRGRRSSSRDSSDVDVGIARTMPPRGEHAGGARGRDALPRHDRRGAPHASTSRTSTSPRRASPPRWRSASPSPTARRSCWCCACSATAGSRKRRCTCCARG